MYFEGDVEIFHKMFDHIGAVAIYDRFQRHFQSLLPVLLCVQKNDEKKLNGEFCMNTLKLSGDASLQILDSAIVECISLVDIPS